MMRAIWSFWTPPYLVHRHEVWREDRFHLFSWILSFELARRQYPDTVLYTDSAGADVLIDALGLEFGEVHTSLDDLRDADPEWWALGKLSAYAQQRQPFVHIDSDVYLWKALPPRVAIADVIAQSPEYINLGNSCYEPHWLEHALATSPDSWLPPEWIWYRANNQHPVAPCCGIFGGSATAFIRHFAQEAIRLVTCEENRIPLQTLWNRVGHTILVEQYFLGACLAYHRQDPGSPFRYVDLEYLFPSLDDAMNSTQSSRIGYTHLIAGTKSDPQIGRKLEARVSRDYPHLYRRVDRAFAVLRDAQLQSV